MKEYLSQWGIIPPKGFRLETNEETIERLKDNPNANVSRALIPLQTNEVVIINVQGLKIRLTDDFYNDNSNSVASPANFR